MVSQRVFPLSLKLIDLLLNVLFFPFCTAELDALEADMGMETESTGVPSYLQPDKEPDLDAELNLPSAPTGHGAVPPGRQNAQVIPPLAVHRLCFVSLIKFVEELSLLQPLLVEGSGKNIR